MKIGFRLFARQTSTGWVWGEEHMVEGLAKRIGRLTGEAVWVGDRNESAKGVDVMVSFASEFDGVPPTPGARNILWQQFPGALREDRILPLSQLGRTYDFVYCGSRRLQESVNWPGKSEVLYVTADDELPPRTQTASENGIVFVGNHHRHLRSEARLRTFLEPAACLGLAIYGSGWETAPEQLRKRWRGPLNFGRVYDVYRGAAIVMSIHGDNHVALEMPNSRIMEAAACSACVVSDRFPELEKLFGDAVAWTEGNEALRITLTELLGDPPRRERFGVAARRRLLEQCGLEMTARRIIGRSASLMKEPSK